jgi:DNA-binding NarL/FixJ family response regulator
VSGFLVESYLDGRRAEPPESTCALSRREREVVQLVAEGHGNVAVAERLGVSKRTVESHRRRIAEKLGAGDAASLTRWAVKHRLVPPVP